MATALNRDIAMNYLKEEIAEFDQQSLIAPMRLANPNDDFFNFEDNCQPKSNDLELNEFLYTLITH